MIRNPQGGVGPGMGPDDEIREVDPADWTTAVAKALEQYPWFDSLHAVDEIGRPNPRVATNPPSGVGNSPLTGSAGGGEQIRVVCRLVDWSGSQPRGLQLHTRVPRDEPVLDSLIDVVAGAVWHEREAHDFFGVRFTGGDDAPLLFHQPEGVAPLRPLLKDAVLAARVVQPWPGSKDPEDTAQASRRRMSPAGVPEPEVWGARAPGDPAAADEVAQALTGGRVRRRR